MEMLTGKVAMMGVSCVVAGNGVKSGEGVGQGKKEQQVMKGDGMVKVGRRSWNVGPLPVPPKSLVPAPLRFLWFSKPGKDEEEGEVEKNGEDSDGVRVMGKKDCVEEIGVASEVEVGLRVETLVGLEGTDDLDLTKANDLVESDKFLGEKGADKTTSSSWIQNFFNVYVLKRNSAVQCNSEILQSLHEDRSKDSYTDSNKKTKLQLEEARFDADPTNRSGMGRAPEPRGGCQIESRGACAVHADATVALETPYFSVSHDKESFSQFLQEVPQADMKSLAQTSFLCNLAYMIPDIKPGELAKYHHLSFVTSSLDLKAEARAIEREIAAARERIAAANQAGSLTKGEADSSNQGDEVKVELSLSPATAYALAAAAASFLRLQRKSTPTSNAEVDAKGARPEKRTEQDENCTGEETEAVMKSHPHSADNPEPEKVFPRTESTGNKDESVVGISDTDVSTFMGPVTSVVGAERETKQEVVNKLRSLHTCPCEWFTCDEVGSHTRFFVIQGSESFASWQANLLFEPVEFEENLGFGVMVHRGIYEAAKGLYEQILPCVLAHVQLYGDRARFCFTGHSLGGSLAMLLTFLLKSRGVVQASSFLPVYAFGSPYIMCGGDYLLEKLGFHQNHARHIILHRDIVPRTFACNYPDHVAEILRRVNGTFREHSCLNQQKLMYSPMGQMIILQPSEQQASPHPLLPAGGGLYVIRHQRHDDAANGCAPSRPVQVRAAQRAFLNTPHPLEILSDPGAYGSEGLISQHHHPGSYLKAINSVWRQEMRRWRKIQREQRRQLWWPLINADTTASMRNGTMSTDLDVSNPFSQRNLCGPLALSNFGSDVVAGRTGLPVSASEARKGRLRKYRSLIASQHVQMGMLLVFSARMLVTSGFAAVVAWV